LVQETQRLARDPFLADRFRDGLDRGEGDIFRHFDLARFADRVGLRPLERLVLASSIVTAPTRKELSLQAASMIRVEFENAVLALCQHPSFDHADLSPAQVAKLLSNLLELSTHETPILDGPQRQALIAAAQAKYGTEVVAPILQQIIPRLRLGGFVFVVTCTLLTERHSQSVCQQERPLFRLSTNWAPTLQATRIPFEC
jgi:CCR4-NOT transcription complex subunit 1